MPLRRFLLRLACCALAAIALPAEADPLRFEPNRGQAGETARYVARGPGYTLALADDGAAFSLNGAAAATLRMRLTGAQRPRAIVGEQPLPGVANYIELGSGRTRAAAVPASGRVRVAGVYPGTDLVYYGRDGQLEFDFVLAPGADPHRIGWRIAGAQKIALADDGALELALATRTVRFHAPVAYQHRAGRRVAVASRFRLDGDRVGFDLGAYDRERELVIDPVFVYASYLGGSGDDYGRGVVVDAAGEAYVTGATCSGDFPLANAIDSTLGGTCDAFISKFAADGRTLVFSTYLGGPGSDFASGIALDPAGNIYLTGYSTPSGDRKAFELKLNPAGSAVIYTHTLATNGCEDDGLGVVADAAGNAYIVGTTNASDFPIVNAITPNYAGGYKGFLRKLDASGNILVSTYLGTTVEDVFAIGVTLDSGGNVVMTGRTHHLDYRGDVFVTRLGPDARTFGWSRTFGGDGQDRGASVAADGAGNVYVAGGTDSTDFPVVGGYRTSGPSGDGFIAKFDSAGNMVASTYVGHADYDDVEGIALAPDGSVVVTGSSVESGSATHTMMARVSAGLGALLGEALFGTSDYGESVAVDGAGAVYVVSDTSFDQPVTPGAFQTSDPGGATNVHVAKISWSNPTLSVANASRNEGNAGQSNLGFPVTLSARSATRVSFNYATTNGTATAGSDYVASSGVATIEAGLPGVSVAVPVVGDAVDEADESFVVNLGAPVNATIADGQATGTILDDDAAPAISAGNVSVTEGDSGTVTALLPVTLSAASGQTVRVNWTAANGTASAPGDYVAGSGTLTFSAGETSKTIALAVNGDTLDEPNETFVVNLAAPVNATIADAQGVVTIVDDDEPALAVDNVGCSVNEGAAGATTNCAFVFRLSSASTSPVTFNTATASVSAAAGVDYTAQASTARTIPAGQTTLAVNVVVLGDALDEGDETFTLNATAISGATPATLAATGTIVDDDDAPALGVDNGGCGATEADSTAVNCAFVFRLSAASGRNVTFTTSTTAGTATSGADFTAHANVARTIPAGATTLTVSVPVLGDLLDEADETFTLTASSVANATPSSLSATGTIVDDDPAPALSVDNGGCSATEAASCSFVFRLSAASGRPVTFNTATAGGTATSGADFTGHAATARTIAAGQTTLTVAVPTTDDAVDEPNETFTLSAGAVVNATPASLSATGTIVDDDGVPTVAIGDCNATEGDSGTSPCTFTVTLSNASGATVGVSYATANGTASAGEDYVGATGTLSFSAGTTSRTIAVGVVGDTRNELAESFTVTLSAPTNATLGDATGNGSIADNDPLPEILGDGCEVLEGDSGTVSCIGSVALSAASGRTVTVHYATADGAATAPADYAATSGTVTFAPGETQKTFVVAVVGDTIDEGDEDFTILYSAPVAATLLGSGAKSRIIDDDSPAGQIRVTRCHWPVPEQNPSVTIGVERVGGAQGAISVPWSTTSLTAIAGQDFQAASGALSWAAGESATKTLSVPLINSAAVEPDEQFAIVLGSPTGGATLGVPNYAFVDVMDGATLFHDSMEDVAPCVE